MSENSKTSSDSNINDQIQTEANFENWETPAMEILKINISTEVGPVGSGPVPPT